MTRKAYGVCFSLLLIITCFSLDTLAGDVPYTLSLMPMVFSYSSAGDYHVPETLTDEGVAIDFTYPLDGAFRLKALTFAGFSTGYQFYGAGIGYDFGSSKVFHQQEGDAVEITSFAKWRPYVDVEIGYNSAQTRISAGTINTDVTENLLGGVGRVGTGYALNQIWELNCNFMLIYGASPNVSIIGYGLAAGVKLNMF